jgi:hypothetical protein
MWICLNDGFFSIVRDTSSEDGLLVRCRSRAHLEHSFPSHDVEVTRRADYGWRTRATRSDVVEFLERTTRALDYPNFKASVADRALHDLYADFWELHWRYQRDQR